MENVIDNEMRVKLKKTTRRIGAYVFKIIAMLSESDLNEEEIEAVCEQVKDHFEKENEELETAIKAVEDEFLKDLTRIAK